MNKTKPKYTSISLKCEVAFSIEKMAKKMDLYKSELIEFLVSYYLENEKLKKKKEEKYKDDFLETLIRKQTEALEDLILKKSAELSRNVTKDSNRVIGFVRTNDKFLRNLSGEVLFILNMTPNNMINHPLFNSYQTLFGLIKKSIKNKEGVQKDLEYFSLLKSNLSDEDKMFFDEMLVKINYLTMQL